jgi:cobalt-zinc-cadmium efflux system outer membrane protein
MTTRLRGLLPAVAALALSSMCLAAWPANARPITVMQAVDNGLTNSPLIRAAEASVAAAEARARQAGVRSNPEVEVELENALGSGPYSGLGGSEVTVALGQRFERGGKRPARVALAMAEVELASAQLDRVRADLVRDVRTAYADLTAASGRVALAREATARSRELVRTATLLVETGRDPPLRQFRAEAELAEAEAAEGTAEAELERAVRALATLMGSPEERFEPDGPPDRRPADQPTTGAVIALRIAQAERRIADARIDVQLSGARSDITVRAGVRGYAESGDVALVAGFSMPLAVRDTNAGNIEAARADLLAADARLAQVRFDVDRERRDAETLLTAADARLTALEGPGLDQAREAVRVAELGYSAGRFSLLEVLDAQTALTELELSIIEARRDRAKAIAALERAHSL